MIIIIDNFGSFTYNLFQEVVKFHSQVEVIESQNVNLQDLAKAKPIAVLLTSGPGLPQENPINGTIVKQMAPTTPLLGISLGHLAIGETFGATIEPIKTFDHGKTVDINYQQDDLFSTLSNPFKAGCYHAFRLSRKNFPTELRILAESPDGTIMAIRHHTYPSYGVQFYPDTVLTKDGNQLLKNFVELAKNYQKIAQ